MIGDPNDETNFPHKLLLTSIQVSRLRKAFGYGSSANIRLSKSQLSKTVQSGAILEPVSLFLFKKKNRVSKRKRTKLS